MPSLKFDGSLDRISPCLVRLLGELRRDEAWIAFWRIRLLAAAAVALALGGGSGRVLIGVAVAATLVGIDFVTGKLWAKRALPREVLAAMGAFDHSPTPEAADGVATAYLNLGEKGNRGAGARAVEWAAALCETTQDGWRWLPPLARARSPQDVWRRLANSSWLRLPTRGVSRMTAPIAGLSRN